MKRAVRVVAILGAMLQGGAHAAEQSATVEPSLEKAQKKVAIAQQAPSLGKKAKSVQSKTKSSKGSADAVANERHEGVAETLSDTTEQSIQLKGVRG